MAKRESWEVAGGGEGSTGSAQHSRETRATKGGESWIASREGACCSLPCPSELA